MLPMFHAYGLTLCLTFAMSMGARLVLFPKFDPDLVLKVVKKHPATFLPAVPPIYDRLTKAAAAEGVSLDGIRIAISGAMPLSAEVVEPWEAASGGYLVEGYGLSECSPVLMANPVAPTRKAGTVGLPLPSTEVRVVDPDDPTIDVAPASRGRADRARPAGVLGVLEEARRDRGGVRAADRRRRRWFRTGDIVAIDDEGFVRIVDRIKELIITGGFNVGAERGRGGAARAPRRRRTPPSSAFPTSTPASRSSPWSCCETGRPSTKRRIRDFARDELAAYKVPKRVVQADDLPRSLIGKVLRREVRNSLLNG